jgi:hypothetical protein
MAARSVLPLLLALALRGLPAAAAPAPVALAVVTWNWAELAPAADDVAFLRALAAAHDVVAVGVQELEDLKVCAMVAAWIYTARTCTRRSCATTAPVLHL